MSEDLITRIVNEFDPVSPLQPNDRRYVECSAERGSTGLFKTLANSFRRSQKRTCQLLSGHRGCGKTTELYRLKQDLLTNEPRQFVVYCEADHYLDLNDVEYTDVLLGVVQQLWSDAAHAGVRLEPGKLEALLGEIAVIIKGASLKEAKIKASLPEILEGELTAEIKKNPDNRQRIREHLRPRTPSFLEAVNEIISRAAAEFKDQGYSGLVIIVDNLDRVYRNPVPGISRNSHEALFLDAGDHLRGLACDVIYTLPPAALYALTGTRLSTIFGSQPQMLPMIPVARRSIGEDENGIAKPVETIDRRLREAGTTRDQAFDSEDTVKRLCIASGGYLRSLMTLAQTASNYVNDLPITRDAVEQTIRDA